MKRAILAAIALIIFTFPHQVSAGVNDFEIRDYQIDYQLDKDTENHSTLTTVETIQAVFPEFDQNHGIERAIPNSYHGHETRVSIQSVTDIAGKPLTYVTRNEGALIIVRIGDADRYVHGLQTYRITYTQRDVTRYFADNNLDEFYWDTNGTAWAVPIRSLRVNLRLSDSVRSSFAGQKQCYEGFSGSNTTCAITATADGFTASATDLAPYENVTIAIGFNPGTFAQYKMSLLGKIILGWVVLQFLLVPVAIGLFIWLIVAVIRRSNRLNEVKTIVPEYIPPKNASVSTASVIYPKRGSVFTAQILDLAVRHYLKIYQTAEKKWYRPAKFELEIIKDISDLRAEEREWLDDIFGNPQIGARIDMSHLRNNQSVALKLFDNPQKLGKDISGKYGLRAKDPVQSAWFKRTATIILVTSLLTISPSLLVVALVAFALGHFLQPLTDQGLELYRYLKGLEMYIKVAEEERLKMVQSPEGAAKVGAPIDGNDKRELIKLYERVLPYAVMFGQEKQWNKQLGQYYESVNETPSWYVGHVGVFNASTFTSTMSSFGQSASYSSGSSGSSGGGSSGGGGGGGGGGGW